MKKIYQAVNYKDLVNIIKNEEIILHSADNLKEIKGKVITQFTNNEQPYDELLKNYLCVKVFKRALMDSKFKIHDDDKSLADYIKKKDQDDRRFLKIYHYLFEYSIDENALKIEDAIKYHYPMLQIKINTNYETFKSKILEKVLEIFNHTCVSDFNLKRDKQQDIVFEYKADDKMLGKVINEDAPLVDVYKLVQHILSFDLIDVDMPIVPVIQEPYLTRVFCFNKNLKADAVRYVFNTLIMSENYKLLPNGKCVMSLGRVKKVFVKKDILKEKELENLTKLAKEKKVKLIIK